MLSEAWSWFLHLYSLAYQALAPCSLPQQLMVKTINHQQYLGKWYFKAAVSHQEADIQKFRAFDNMVFTIEETANDTLVLTGNMRMGDDCIKQSWTYHIQPERDDMVMEGRTFRRNLFWSGTWANCLDCIIFQEVEPPLRRTDSVDSLNRFMLYARQKDISSEVVTTFLKNSACHQMKVHVTLPEEKEFCI
ncbi:apolipoprotein M [Oryzias melastigma]|uniref:Apolipoprotein M n=1 Tax=Oryzias melastigma TaxID=30732 RepID=A0A3B3DU28_ORYME|nr:apolipoprotein M [Oryzias melastigma]